MHSVMCTHWNSPKLAYALHPVIRTFFLWSKLEKCTFHSAFLKFSRCVKSNMKIAQFALFTYFAILNLRAKANTSCANAEGSSGILRSFPFTLCVSEETKHDNVCPTYIIVCIIVTNILASENCTPITPFLPSSFLRSFILLFWA